jgi:predicted metalloprotease with PDZ domain
MISKVWMTIRVGLVSACAFLFVAVLPATATIRYKIFLEDTSQHRFRVQMVISNPGEKTDVALPAWNALYQVRDFAYRVRDVRVRDASAPDNINLKLRPKLVVLKLDKQTWRVTSPYAPMPSDITIRYTIEWDDPGPFNSQLNAHHAFVNFAEVLMYVPDRRNEETEVTFVNVPSDWQTISELPAGSSSNSFKAASYDDLVDAPVEAGKFEQFDFDNEGAHFRVVVDAKDWNKSRLEDDLRRITGYELKLMGGPPFKEYTFFFHIGAYPEAGGGGMEHSNCTAISAGSVEGAVQIAAHEFFHAWNVKRIRPQALQPVNFTKEQFTRALWFAEGVTSTYGAYTLERSGLWSKDEFYSDLGSQIEVLQSRPAHTWQSAEESSLDTWFDKYDAYGLPDRSISYYNKGQILGVMLDLAIRDATDNRKSLDDVLRGLNDEYAKQGKFYDESRGIRSVVEEVAGKSFGDFFAHYVGGTDEIPYGDFLAFAGLELKAESVKLADTGFSPVRAPGGVAISSITPGGPAEAAGLHEGDVIIEVNGHPFPRGRGGLLSGLSAGETVKFHVTRQGQEMDISYVLGTREDTRYSIKEISRPTDRQHRIREGILHGTAD